MAALTRPRWPPGGRLALWLTATIGGLLAAGAVLPRAVSPALRAPLLAVLVALVSLASWRLLDGRPPRLTPLALTGKNVGAAALGCLAGAGLALAAVGALWLAGSYHFAPGACDAGSALRRAGGLALWLGGAAALEEVLFRGYAFTTLHAALTAGPAGRGVSTSAPAVVATAVAFSLAHWGGPQYGWGAGVALLLMGIVLGLVVVSSGTLWSGIGLHAGWNTALAVGAALPVSGVRFPAPCGTGTLAGPAWLTGGSFGVEAGVPALLVWGVLGLVVVRAKRYRPMDSCAAGSATTPPSG